MPDSRPVTVVLCDIANTAQLGERLDPEVLRAILSRYSREMRGVLEEHGGTIETLIGTAVMAVFDDALPAVTAAAELGTARDELNEELEADWGVHISTRTGVSTGEVPDDAVNLATRLEQTATVGEVWVGETTLRLVGDAAEFEDAGLLRVKGKGEAVHAWRLAPAPTEEPDDPELESLEAAFESVVTERACRVVTVVESRLLDALAERLGERARVLRGRCTPSGEPLSAVAEAVDLDSVPRPALPEERFAAVHQALERSAEGQPLAVIFDDVQLAQQTFLDLIDYLPLLPSHSPILVVCASREEASDDEDDPRDAAQLAADGRRAKADGDLPTAADLLQRAEALLPADDPERLALLPELGEALCDLGELARADELLAEAVEDARAAGDRRVEMSAELARAYVDNLVGADGAAERLRAVGERAVALFGELDDDAGLARAWHALGIVHSGACRWGAAEGARRHGIEHARAAGERGLELRAQTELAYALYFGPTPVDSAIEAVEEWILPRTRGFPVAEATVLGVFGGLRSMQARFDEARELHARARDMFAQLGPALPGVEGALNASDTELLADDPEHAELILRAAYATLESAHDAPIRTSVAAALAQALAARGRDDEALAFTEESERTASAGDIQPQVTWRAVRASVLARRDETEEAERLAEEAVELARETDDPNLLATALLAAGETDEAASLYEAKGNAAALRTLSRSAGP